MKVKSKIIIKLLEKLIDKLTIINSHYTSLFAFINNFNLNLTNLEV